MHRPLQSSFPHVVPEHLLPGSYPTGTNERNRVPYPFGTGIQQVTSSVGTVSVLIFDTDNTSTTTYGALGSITAGDVLKDLVIVNTGSNTMYVGFGSISVASTNGAQVVAGGTMYLYGYNVTSTAASATGDVWAQTGVVNQTTSCIVGLATSPAGV
jgi:hypothetical protein